MVSNLHTKVFQHLQQLSTGFYHRNTPGDITALRFSTGIASIENVILFAPPTNIMSLLGLVFSSVVLFIMQCSGN